MANLLDLIQNGLFNAVNNNPTASHPGMGYWMYRLTSPKTVTQNETPLNKFFHYQTPTPEQQKQGIDPNFNEYRLWELKQKVINQANLTPQAQAIARQVEPVTSNPVSKWGGFFNGNQPEYIFINPRNASLTNEKAMLDLYRHELLHAMDQNVQGTRQYPFTPLGNSQGIGNTYATTPNVPDLTKFYQAESQNGLPLPPQQVDFETFAEFGRNPQQVQNAPSTLKNYYRNIYTDKPDSLLQVLQNLLHG